MAALEIMNLMESGEYFCKQSEFPTQGEFISTLKADYDEDWGTDQVHSCWLAWRVGLWDAEDYPKGAYEVIPGCRKQPRGATRGWIASSDAYWRIGNFG